MQIHKDEEIHETRNETLLQAVFNFYFCCCSCCAFLLLSFLFILLISNARWLLNHSVSFLVGFFSSLLDYLLGIVLFLQFLVKPFVCTKKNKFTIYSVSFTKRNYAISLFILVLPLSLFISFIVRSAELMNINVKKGIE